jgi:hypothetical protein
MDGREKENKGHLFTDAKRNLNDYMHQEVLNIMLTSAESMLTDLYFTFEAETVISVSMHIEMSRGDISV